MLTKEENTQGAEDTGGISSTPTVTITEQDIGDEEEERASGEGPQRQEPAREKNGQWTAKKAARGEQRNTMKSELETLRGNYSALQRKLDEMSTNAAAERIALLNALGRGGDAGGNRQAPQAGPIDAKIDSLRDQILAERQLLVSDTKRTTDRYDKLQDERNTLIAERAYEARAKAQPQQPQQQGGGRYQVRQMQMESEFPWLATDEQASKAAGAYRQFLLLSGRPDTLETDRAALAHVAAERGLGFAAPASARNRQALAGPGGNTSIPPRNGVPRQVEVDPRMLRGTGLPQGRLQKIIFSGNDEE